jgi:hypothetical protein
MLLNIVPKLAAHIDNDFEVNPLDQKMEPLDRVLNWSSLLRESTFAQIIEEKFFPSWLDTLHFWHPGKSFKWRKLVLRALKPARSGITSGRITFLGSPPPKGTN